MMRKYHSLVWIHINQWYFRTIRYENITFAANCDISVSNGVKISLISVEISVLFSSWSFRCWRRWSNKGFAGLDTWTWTLLETVDLQCGDEFRAASWFNSRKSFCWNDCTTNCKLGAIARLKDKTKVVVQVLTFCFYVC